MNDKLKESIDVIKGMRSWQESGDMVNPPHSTKEWNKAIDTVVAEVEKPTYTAQDMEAFAEWCSENGWSISIKKHRWVNDNGEGINTAQLREQWEQERREK